MTPSLTIGSIKKILNGENVPNPVFQVLSCRKIPSNSGVRYHFLISDGLYGYSDVVAGIQLHQTVNEEIEDFTVVRVDKYYCKKIHQLQHKVIILVEYTILAPGKEVNKKIGSAIRINFNAFCPSAATSKNSVNDTENIHTSFKIPFYSNLNSTEKTGTESETGTISVTEMIKFLNLERYTMVPSLSSGFIHKILNGEDVTNAVFQVIDFVKIPGAKIIRYQLMISDGVVSSSFFILGTKLNHMVDKKELEKLDVIRVDRYACNQDQADRKVVIVLSLTVLVPGSEINKVLGNPINSNTVSSSTARPSEKETDHAVDSTQS